MTIKKFIDYDIMKEKGFRRLLILMGLMLIISGILIGYQPVNAVTSRSYTYLNNTGLGYQPTSVWIQNSTIASSLVGFGFSGKNVSGSTISSRSGTVQLFSTGAGHPLVFEGSYGAGETGIAISITKYYNNYPGTARCTISYSGGIASYYASSTPNPTYYGIWLTDPGATSGMASVQTYYTYDNFDYPNVTAYPTPTYVGSCWNIGGNYTNTTWLNCTLPNGTWGINGSINIIPTMNTSIYWINLTNRTNITELFNSTLIDINIVNKYLDIVDIFSTNLRGVIATVLNTLLYPVTWLAQQMNNFVNLLFGYVNNLLFYLRPIAFMFQIMIAIIPPVLIYLGCVLLLLDFAWWILYGRK